jgi:hypothetical protein
MVSGTLNRTTDEIAKVRRALKGFRCRPVVTSILAGCLSADVQQVRSGLPAGANGIRTVGPPSAASLKEAHLSSSSGGVDPRSVTLPEFVD